MEVTELLDTITQLDGLLADIDNAILAAKMASSEASEQARNVQNQVLQAEENLQQMQIKSRQLQQCLDELRSKAHCLQNQ